MRNAIIEQSLGWLTAVKKPLPKEETLRMIDTVKGWLDEEIEEFRAAVIADDVDEQANAIVDAMWITNNLAFFAGLSAERLATEGMLVSMSNYTKFCMDEEEAIQSVKMYANGTHPNKLGKKIETQYLSTGNPAYPYYIATLDGKIFKSYKFKDVDVIREQMKFLSQVRQVVGKEPFDQALKETLVDKLI